MQNVYKLASRLTILVACLSVLAMAPGDAAIVFTVPPEPIHAGISPDEPAAEIDLNSDGVLDLIIPGSNREINVYPQGTNRVVSMFDIGSYFAVALSEGTFIGAEVEDGNEWVTGEPIMAGCFNAGGVFCAGNFLGGIAYLGAEFDIGGNTHYGWLEIRSREDIQFIDVLSWAYESEPETGILAGAIPEPSAALMLLGGALLLLRRGRKGSVR